MKCLKEFQVEIDLPDRYQRKTITKHVRDHGRELGYTWYTSTRSPRSAKHYMTFFADGEMQYTVERVSHMPLYTVRDFLALKDAQALPEYAPEWLKYLYQLNTAFGEEALEVWLHSEANR